MSMFHNVFVERMVFNLKEEKMELVPRSSMEESKNEGFEICLLEKIQQYGESCARGEIRIDGFSELFFSPLIFWGKADYYENWMEQLSKLDLVGKAFLPTTMYSPESVNFIFGWSIYIEGDFAFLQNNLIFAKDLPVNFNFRELNKIAPARKTVSDEGVRISEWKTSRKSILDFSMRLHKNLYGPW